MGHVYLFKNDHPRLNKCSPYFVVLMLSPADQRAVDDQDAEGLAALVHGLLLQDLSPPITYEFMKIGHYA